MSEPNRKRFNEYKEKLKNLNTELKSMKTMLDKSNSSWSKFTDSYELVDKWLDQQDKNTEPQSVIFLNPPAINQ